LQVANVVCESLGSLRPKKSGSYSEQIAFVEDRPGHDKRYAIDCSKIKAELNWSPEVSFEKGISETVLWYLNNIDWCEQVVAEREELGRMGLGRGI